MINGSRRIDRPIRWAMVGGGSQSQIGYIHRSAAQRDQNFVLVAGAFDIDPARGREFGEQLGGDPERCYPDYRQLIEQEARRQDGIEAISVATPNGTHFSITKAALGAGLHVVCEKPLCFTLEEAETLRDIARARQCIVGAAETLQALRYPDVHAGIEGVRWVQRCVESADRGGLWIDY